MIDLDKIGAVLKNRRQDQGITQQEVADELGLTKNHVSDIERGVHRLTVQTFCGYCKILNTTPNELLEFTDKDNIIPELKNFLSDLSVEEQKKVLAVAKVL